ncbi:MAG: hypothetical protein NC833_03090 [Candidatus Omnitrophica bacterium]|nr:hypothetical protein [Candidatus Omnitrophota bacterium]
MPEYVPLFTKIWSDTKFKKLSKEAKLLFLYLGWNPNINLLGIYEPDWEVTKVQTKLGDIKIPLTELINEKMIFYDEEHNLIFVKNHFKYQPKNSPLVKKGVIRELNQLNHLKFKNLFIQIYYDYIKDSLSELKKDEQKTN